MEVIGSILSAIAVLIIPLALVFGIPKSIQWYELNLSQDYLENRGEKKVRDLRKQLKVIQLEKEAIELEKKLSDTIEERNKK